MIVAHAVFTISVETHCSPQTDFQGLHKEYIRGKFVCLYSSRVHEYLALLASCRPRQASDVQAGMALDLCLQLMLILRFLEMCPDLHSEQLGTSPWPT